MTETNARFTGAIPAAYDRYLGPLLFEPYARDLTTRLPWRDYSEVLELAAGTGILTHHLRAALAPAARLTASDLSHEMLAIAQQKYPDLPVTWEQADAQALPFADSTFDAVACQFGLMFFPEKPAACREARRVLKRGGHFIFSVWDSLAHNPLGAIARTVVNRYFVTDPPTFYEVPFGFSDQATLRAWLTAASFEVISMVTHPIIGESPSAVDAAAGIVAGNPTIVAVRERATAPAEAVIEATATAVAAEYGAAPCRLPMQALIVTARAI